VQHLRNVKFAGPNNVVSCSYCRQAQGIGHFSTSSRLALLPTQPPIRQVYRALSRGGKAAVA